MPKVSIVVPVYNVEKYIKKCMDSLVNQTLQDIEIIAVNDGSTDDSINILNEYKKRFPNIIKVHSKTNGGLSDARNFGMKYATGEYIAFVDSDDYVEIDMYEKMYNKAKEEDSDMVECDFIWEFPNKKKIDRGVVYRNKNEMIVYARVVAWNKLIRKKIIDEIHIEYPKGLRYEDIEFFYKMVPYYKKVSFVKEPLVHYIQRSDSISNVQNSRTSEIFTVLDNVITYYRKNEIFEEYRNELEYTYARILLCSSFRRMVKISDKQTRKKLLNKTWERLNDQFPDWKKNKYLKQDKSFKNVYMRTINRITFKIYICIIR